MAEIKIVTIDELRQMNDQEGLILQGCGGDLQEWVDGINELFAQAGILQAGSAWKAEAVRSFQYDGLTNLLFPFVKGGSQTGTGENRNLAEFPVFSPDTYEAYPSAVNSYINDHAAFKEPVPEPEFHD